MIRKKAASILSITLLLAILASCGAGAVDVQTSARLLSISITPANPQIAKNTSQQLTATGFYSDNTTRDLTEAVTWSSSDTSVATTEDAAPALAETTMLSQAAPKTSGSGNGHAYGKSTGTTTVTATSGSVSGSTTLTVTNAALVSLALTPADPSIAAGTTQQFIATGTFSDNTTQDLTATATWSSSDTGVATIGSATGSQGLATGVAAGTTVITSTSGSVSGTATLAVTAMTNLVAVTITSAIEPPTTMADGTPVTNTDIAGYKIYYGLASGEYTNSVDVGNVTSVTQTLYLQSGQTYYFAVTAYYKSGAETGYSNEQTKVVN